MISWWVGGVLGAVALLTVIWPRWTHIFTAGRYRGPGKRSVGHRLWPVRMLGAIVLAAVAAWAVGEFWPGDGNARAVARTFTLVVVFVGMALWFVAAMVARFDRESRATAAKEDETGQRGIWDGTTPGYGVEIVLVIATAIVATVAGFTLIGMRDQVGQPDAEPSPTPTPTPTVNAADEVLKDFNDLNRPPPVFDAVPDGDSLYDPWWYAVVDADAELPYVVWHQSDPVEGGVPSDYLADADLVLAVPRISCAINGIVVVETDTTVSIGFTHATPNTTEVPDTDTDPDTEPPACNELMGVFREWFPLDLTAPLGDRTVQALDGGRIGEYRR